MIKLVEQNWYVTFCKKFYGYLPLNWKHSHNIVTISIEPNEYIVYNRLLNSPLRLDEEAYIYFKSIFVFNANDEITEDVCLVLREILSSFLLLPDGTDETVIIKEMKSSYLNDVANGKTVTMLDLRVSEACNFGCPHCIAGNAKTGKMMTYDIAIWIVHEYIDFLERHNRDIPIDIHFGIAEPLMNFQTIQRVILQIEKEYPKKIFKYSINTNLSLLDHDMAHFFKEHQIFIHTSIDGLQKSHDRIRVFKNGKGTYDLISDKIRLLHEIDYPLQDVGITVTSQNVHEFSESLDELADWCAKEALSGVAFDFDLIRCVGASSANQSSLLKKFEELLKERGLDFYGTWLIPVSNLIEQSFSTRAYGFCKGVSGFNFSIDADANLFFCSCAPDAICSFKDIEREIKPGGAFYAFVQSNLFRQDSLCKGCSIEGACNGFCEITRSTASSRKYSELCEFLRVVTRQKLISLVKEDAL